MNGAVVVDSGVFSAPLSPRLSPLAALYAPHLEGRRLVIAAQTVADVRYGALVARWGPSRRAELERRVGEAGVAPVDDELLWAHARLRAACRAAGHPLAAKVHIGDLWVAATAVHYGIPLVAHDAVFFDAPDLTLITELAR